MAKSSGGVRGGNSRNKNFTASVSVDNRNGETRWLQKNFRTQKQAEKWIDNVAERFDSPAKSGFARYASIDKDTKRGTIYDVFTRDLTKEFEVKDKRAFRSGQGGYLGEKRKRGR